MNARLAQPRTVGILVVAGFVVMTAVVFSQVFRKPFQPATSGYTVEFERAPQLRPGSQVRLEGNVEGKVTDVSSSPDRRGVRVRFDLEKDSGPLFADAAARLTFKTLLGGVFYIDLDRGSERAGPLTGGTIPLDRTTVQAEIEDVTDATRGEAGRGLEEIPGELAEGLSDPGALASATGSLADVAPDATTALEAIRGQAPGDDLPAVVEATEKTVRALDSSTEDLRTLVAGTASTLGVTSRRQREIRQSIATLPSVTSDMTTTFARLEPTLSIARTLIGRLDGSAPKVAPTLRRLRPTLATTASLLSDARPVTEVLPRTLRTLRSASGDLAPLVTEATPPLKRLDQTILPYLGREDPGTGKPTSTMIGGFLSAFGGAAGQQDGNGHFIRFPASIGLSSLYIPCTSSLVDGSVSAVLACDNFNEALDRYSSYLPALTPTAQKGQGG